MLSKKERKSSSKYDFVRIMIQIDEEGHEYPLSRFILSRILTTAGIRRRVSTMVAFQIKKDLVDSRTKKLTQEELFENLFQLLKKYGKAEKIIRRVKMMATFHQKRVPLLVLLFGTGGVGKTTIANKLSEIINVPAVLHTEVVFELSHLTFGITNPQPVWCKEFDTKEEFLREYQKQCRTVRRSLDGDINKCFNHGKSIIVTGIDMDPLLFEDIVRKYSIQEGSLDEGNLEGRGVIIPFYLRNEDYVDIYMDRFRRNKHFDEISQEKLQRNFSWIKEYIEGLELGMKLECVNVDLLNLKKTIKVLHKKFMQTIENLEILKEQEK